MTVSLGNLRPPKHLDSHLFRPLMPRPQSAHFGYPILSSGGQKSTEMR